MSDPINIYDLSGTIGIISVNLQSKNLQLPLCAIHVIMLLLASLHSIQSSNVIGPFQDMEIDLDKRLIC